MLIRRPCKGCGRSTDGTTYCEWCAPTKGQRFARPCITCGKPARGDYCTEHAAAAEAERNARRVHYHGSYQSRSAKVRATPGPCALCGKGPRRGDPWTAHHVNAGDPDSPLVKAHRSCNSALGNRTQ